MNDIIFTKRNTVQVETGNLPYVVDEKKEHWVIYGFSFTKEDNVIIFTADLTSNVNYGLHYEIKTITTFESENALLYEDIVSLIHPYIEIAFQDHIELVKNVFRSGNALGIDFETGAKLESYLKPLEDACETL